MSYLSAADKKLLSATDAFILFLSTSENRHTRRYILIKEALNTSVTEYSSSDKLWCETTVFRLRDAKRKNETRITRIYMSEN